MLARQLVLASAVVSCFGVVRAVTVNYTTQIAAFDGGTHTISTNGRYQAGHANNGSEYKQFAYDGGGGDPYIGDPGIAAFRTFSTASSGGSARAFQIGDTFSITCFVNSTSPFFNNSGIGIKFNDNTSYTSFSSRDTNVRAIVQLNKGGTWFGGGTSNVNPGLGAGSDRTFTLKVTSSNTFNLSIAGTTYYDLTMSGSPSSSSRISSFTIWNRTSGNSNDTFWKDASLTDTGTVDFGSDNGSRTISGVIADGLAANSTSTARVNNLVKNGTGSVTLSGANTYTGTTTINDGTLAISSDGNLGTAPGSPTDSIFIKDGKALRADGGDVTLDANRRVVLNGSANTNSWISANTGFTLTINGQVKPGSTGPNGLVKFGNGTLVLANSSNSYTGSTYITNGTLAISAGASIANSANVQVGEVSGTTDAALLLSDSDGGHDLANAVLVRSGSSGTKRLVSANATGTNTFSGSVTLNDSVIVQGTNGGTVAFSGGSIDLKGNTLTIDGANSTHISASLQNSSGSGKLVKQGSGVMTLAPGTHSYTGTTTVNAGKLLVNGTHSGGDDYTINSGTLGGSGTITLASGKKVQVNANGTLAPGTSPGTLTLNGDLTIAGGTSSTLEFEFVGSPGDPADEAQGGVDFDVLNVSGTLSLGSLRLNIVAPHDGVKYYTPYTIITAGNIVGAFGQLNNQVTTSNQYRLAWPNYNVGISGTSITITFVPEPAALGMLAFGGLLGRRPRRVLLKR